MSWGELFDSTALALGDEGEARVLVEEAAGLRLAALLSRLEETPSSDELARLDAAVSRRRRGEPLQHVIGHWSFRTLELRVDERALIPRPETEIVVECALTELAKIRAEREAGAELVAVDLGTGSGAIACSLVSEAEDVRVLAVDCSEAALELAVLNRDLLSRGAASRLEFAQGDWYGALGPSWRDNVDCVVANPPYVSTTEWAELDPVVRDFDPYGALVAGSEGTEAIESVIVGARGVLRRPGSLVVEIAPHQASRALLLAGEAEAIDMEIRKDLAGRDRVLCARW